MWALGWLACAPAPAALDADELGRMDGVVYQTETLRIETQSAWLTPDQPIQATETTVVASGTAPPLEITGKTSTWELARQVVVFETEVTAVRGDVTLTCDRLEVTYAGERVDTAVATGMVRVVKGERIGTAQRAVLTAADGRIEMTEDPQLAEGPHTMRGERITLFLDAEQARCDACRLVVAPAAIQPQDGP